jgi:uncharacterized protein (TIGR02145 family)
VSLEIGTGTVLSGSFASINWANGPYLIKTETDPTGGTNYGIAGIAPLNSVPYALYAANGTPGPKGDKGDTGATGPAGPAGATGPQGVTGLLTNGSAAGNTPYWNGSTWVTNTSNIFNNGGDIGIGTAVPTEKLDVTGKVKASGTVTAGTVTYPNAHGSANQVLTTTGSGTLTWTTPSSSGIPYTGATQAVDLGAYDLKVNGLTVGRGIGNQVSNSAIGNVALNSNTTGSGNTATGYRTLSNTTTGSNNTATGSEALSANSTGSSNTATGQSALRDNTTGGSNTATGARALESNTTGSKNTAIGESSMLKNTTGSFNTATGHLSLSSNTTGEFNTAYGSYSMEKNTTGSENIAFGGEAFRNNTTGSFNVAVGTGTLGSNTTGGENTAIGRRAMNDNLTGTFNTAIGQAALYANKTGSNNTAMGRTSLVYNTEGESNTAIGATSITNNTTGSNNTGIGYNVLGANTTGGSNTAIGYNAGNTLTTGSNNTFLGNNANAGANNLSNATALGNGAVVAVSNTVLLGNTSVTNVKTSGTVTAGAITYPNTAGATGQVLTTDGSGTASWGTPATGLPSSGNTPGDMLYWNGQAWVKVAAGSNGQILSIVGNTPTWQKPAIPSMGPTDVYNHETGKVWMDRNLGATQVANSSTDYLAYGSLYQWGRGSDGHELITWTNSTTGTPVNGTTSTLSDQPVEGKFILGPNTPYDWRSSQNANLWQGVNGVNNPCPTGYRIPTEAEWNAERLSWSYNTSVGAFASPLKLPMAGFRSLINGGLATVGANGYYWSSTASGSDSRNLDFSSNYASMGISSRAYGSSVRCIKD